MTKDTITKLKIGFLLDDGLDKPDGVQQYILTLGKWFKHNGHEVRYLVGESKRKDIPELIELSKNLKVTFNGNKLSIPLWPKIKKIKSTLKKEKFDVIHVQVPFSPLMGNRVINSLPNETAVVGTFHILPLKNTSFYSLGNKATAASIRSGLRRIDKQFSVSKPAQKFSKEMYKIDSEVLPNPIKLQKTLKKSKDFNKISKFKIAFLGRLVPRKGCLTLLEAINDLDEEHKKKVQVSIGGTGPDRKALESYVRSKNLENTVKFYGFVEEAAKNKFLNESDIAVFPSKGGESFGIVLTEAMASFGPIVLAGDNPGYRSVLENEKLLFDPSDFKKLAEKIIYFMDHPSEMNAAFNFQQKLVKNYDIDKIGERLLVNFRSIVQNKSK
ncbi:MAG TPA: glycosyltransferase family 4 protein [Candidatus Saccharimonadales bacterium]|nr:glycosyltransferase family 4 protein [Candidatus Saccharimonadales bacterium]